MRDVAYYTDLIPSWNATQPNFVAMVQALVQPLVGATGALYTVRDSFDLDTAVGVQLDQVGEWIGRSRNIVVPLTSVFFSWNTSGLGWQEGYWLGPNAPSTGVVSLDDVTYRQLLQAKAKANLWDGTIAKMPAIYQILTGGVVSIADHQDMSMTVQVSGVAMPPLILQLLTGGYIPLKPMGVRINYLVTAVAAPLFGFDLDNEYIAGFDEGYFGVVY